MKKRKHLKEGPDSTQVAIAVAGMAAIAAIQGAEIIYDNIRGTGAPSQDIPLWRAHMGSACAASVTFVVVLFLLEILGRRSKVIALRSTLPWLPIVAITAVATAIHIPMYLVILAAAAYSPWAYSRTRAIR